jgi:hypothetical protein
MLQQFSLAGMAELEHRVERQIYTYTFGRLRQLQVEVDHDRVIVRGWTNSYYVVQLVVRAIREVLPETPVNLDIVVGSSEEMCVRQSLINS